MRTCRSRMGMDAPLNQGRVLKNPAD
jgi:hypothetical protein